MPRCCAAALQQATEADLQQLPPQEDVHGSNARLDAPAALSGAAHLGAETHPVSSGLVSDLLARNWGFVMRSCRP